MSTERRLDRLDDFLTGPVWPGQARLRRIVESVLDRQAAENPDDPLPALQRTMLAAADGVSPLPAVPSPVLSSRYPTHLQFLAAHYASLGQHAEAASYYAGAAMVFMEQGHVEHGEKIFHRIDEYFIGGPIYSEFLLEIHREKEKSLLKEIAFVDILQNMEKLLAILEYPWRVDPDKLREEIFCIDDSRQIELVFGILSFYGTYKSTHADSIKLLARLLLPVTSGMNRARVVLLGAIHAAYGSVPDNSLHRRMVDLYWQDIEPTLPPPLPQTKERRPGRWRVGFIDVSGGTLMLNYYQTTIGGSLAALARDRFETFFYLPGVTDVPGHLQRDVEHVRIFASCDELNQAAALVAGDELDALLLISGFHPLTPLKLLASHPARRQALWHHTFTTCGPELFDAIIVDKMVYTDQYAAQISEPAILIPEADIPGTGMLLSPVPGALALSPPHHRNGHISFGVFNRVNKITPHMLRLWKRILLENPGSVIHFANVQLFDSSHFAQLTALLADCNFDIERVLFHREPDDPGRYFSFYHEIDIQLDTYPFNGGLVTVESLWHGVPVVTRAGDAPLSRTGLTFLPYLDLADLAAFDDDAYVGIASALARDSTRLTDLRAKLRDRLIASPLMDRELFARNFEEALQRLFTYPVRRRSQ